MASATDDGRPGRLTVVALGTRFVIDAGSRWLEVLSELWRPLIPEVEAAPEVLMTLVPSDRGWRLRHPETEEFEDPWQVLFRIRALIIRFAVERQSGALALHAASVGRRGEGVLIAGPGGAGKTTLALLLCREGLTLMSDDVTPLDLATGKIGPFPKPIAIKSPGMFPELESWSTSTWLPPHQGVYLAPADRATEPPRELTDARIVLFVDFQDGATYDVSPVSRAESIALLASQAASLSSTEVMALGKLSQRVRGYRVVYGEAKAVGDLMSILNSVLLS